MGDMLRVARVYSRFGAPKPFVIPNRTHKQIDIGKELEMISDKEAAELAAKQKSERVLIPLVFQERITDGFGTYLYSHRDHLEDVENYTKQIELAKKDVSM